MGFSLSDLNPFSAAKKVTKAVAKPFRKASKFLPREMRWMAPYLSAAVPFALPGGFTMAGMNPALSRGIMSSLANIGGQAIADPEGEDINLLSTLLAGGAGALGAEGMGKGLRRGIEGGAGPWTMEGVSQQPVGFLQGAENLGREGLAQAADFLGGSAEGLASLGQNPASLFSTEGAKAAATDIAPLLVQGTGDVAKASADKYIRDWEATDAAEQAEIEETTTANDSEAARLTMKFNREAGNSEEVIQETLELNGLSEYYEPPVTAAQGGIIGLKNGGMLNLGGNEMDYRGGGFVPIGKRERADDVPARLSKNEFVMTADAVKAAGGGSVNKGAQRMYNVMNNLEARA